MLIDPFDVVQLHRGRDFEFRRLVACIRLDVRDEPAV